jgi:hypothetical protein
MEEALWIMNVFAPTDGPENKTNGKHKTGM